MAPPFFKYSIELLISQTYKSVSLIYFKVVSTKLITIPLFEREFDFSPPRNIV